jgi:hypothetical protein
MDRTGSKCGGTYDEPAFFRRNVLNAQHTALNVYWMQVDEHDRRYFMWMAVVCGAVSVYAWIIYPMFIYSTLGQ